VTIRWPRLFGVVLLMVTTGAGLAAAAARNHQGSDLFGAVAFFAVMPGVVLLTWPFRSGRGVTIPALAPVVRLSAVMMKTAATLVRVALFAALAVGLIAAVATADWSIVSTPLAQLTLAMVVGACCRVIAVIAAVSLWFWCAFASFEA
jgi:hypothetical protein